MFNFCETQFLYLCNGDNHSLRCCVIVRIKCENGWGSILLTREPYTGRGDHSYRFAIWALADFSCPHLRDPAPNCTQSWSTRGGPPGTLFSHSGTLDRRFILQIFHLLFIHSTSWCPSWAFYWGFLRCLENIWHLTRVIIRNQFKVMYSAHQNFKSQRAIAFMMEFGPRRLLVWCSAHLEWSEGLDLSPVHNADFPWDVIWELTALNGCPGKWRG